jgi:hypothetical protein
MAIAIIIVLIVLILGFWWYRKSLKSGYKLYFRTAFNKVAIDKVSAEEAILAGLDKISYRKPYSDLTSTDKENIAKLFGRFNDVTIIEGLILECEKKQNIAPLKNKEELLNFAKYVAQRQKEQGGK